MIKGQIHFADCIAHFKESDGVIKLQNSGTLIDRDSIKLTKVKDEFDGIHLEEGEDS